MQRLVTLALCALCISSALATAPQEVVEDWTIPQLPLCQLPAGFFSYADAVACIRSVPFSEAIRTTTIDSLRKSINVFAFTYPAANIPPTAQGLTIQPTDLYAVCALQSSQRFLFAIT
jgi:hypothetical protein